MLKGGDLAGAQAALAEIEKLPSLCSVSGAERGYGRDDMEWPRSW